MTHKEYLDAIKLAEKYSKAYYDADAPLVPDEEYDRLTQSIKAYEAEHPEDIVAESACWRNRRAGGENPAQGAAPEPE